MFGFIKKCFFTGLDFKFVELYSINNQECKGRPQTVNVNGDGLVFFPFCI